MADKSPEDPLAQQAPCGPCRSVAKDHAILDLVAPHGGPRAPVKRTRPNRKDEDDLHMDPDS